MTPPCRRPTAASSSSTAGASPTCASIPQATMSRTPPAPRVARSDPPDDPLPPAAASLAASRVAVRPDTDRSREQSR